MPRVMQRSYSPMSSQLLNGPFGFAFVLMPPRGRRGATSVRRGMRPSAGSTTSHARWFLRSKVSKIRCAGGRRPPADRKSTRLNSSHLGISYAVFCLKKKKKNKQKKQLLHQDTPLEQHEQPQA